MISNIEFQFFIRSIRCACLSHAGEPVDLIGAFCAFEPNGKSAE